MQILFNASVSALTDKIKVSVNNDNVVVAVAQVTAVVGDLERSVAGHLRLAERAARDRCKLLVFPELSLTGYDRHFTAADALTPLDDRLRPLRDAANDAGMVIVAGAPIVDYTGLHIGAVCFGPADQLAVHLKRHLHDGEDAAFAPGDVEARVSIGNYQIALAICADITHAEHAEAAARSGASIYAAGCFLTEAGYTHDADLLQHYAVRHRLLILMANYSAPTYPWMSAGRSAVWSPTGDLLASAPPAGEALIVAEQRHGEWSARDVLAAPSSTRPDDD